VEPIAPGITCKRLATDHDRQLVTMLVRMAPNTDYPPHRHAAAERCTCSTASCGSTTGLGPATTDAPSQDIDG
jgi:hypothetical protein